ncbi:hypothetical protein KDA00_00340 [Candidatus Saccharibacteria bacterium]|nr:hypothetical protein [Candidatus Saccharibacteria bacterium]
MRADSRNLSLFFILLLACLVSFFIFGSKSSYAADIQGEYIDSATIIIGDKLYRDKYPYDGDRHFSILGSECENGDPKKHILEDFTDDDKKATLKKAKTNSVGECVDDGEDSVTLIGTDKKSVTAYRLDEETVFLPFYFVKTGQSPQMHKDMYYANYGAFKRLAKDASKYNDNQFFLFHDDTLAPLDEQTAGYCDEEGRSGPAEPYDCGGSRVNGDRFESQYCNDGWAPGDGCVSNYVDLVWANNGEFTTPDERAGYVLEGISFGEEGENGSAEAPDITCEVQLFNPLTWIACPLIEAAQLAVQQFDNAITRRLTIPLNDYFDSGGEYSSGFYQAWSTFRYLALILLVIIGLVMVIAQATSWQAVDAYTIKKVMPKIFIAVIAISLSWNLVKFSVDISNELGRGMRYIIYSPFQGLQGPSLGAGAGSLLTLGAGAALFSLGMLGMLSFALTALMAVVIGFAVIIFREMLVMLLAVTVPIAIIAWILPNTQKVWKIWSDFFVKALLAFPIITMMIATGHVFSQIAATRGAGTSGGDSLLYTTIAFIAYFGPYFMIPTAFRLAGGAIAQISGIANDKTRGGFDRLRNFRKGQRDKNWQATKAGTRFKAGKEGSIRSRLNTGLQGASMINRAGFRPSRWKANMTNAIADNRLEGGLEASERLPGAKAFFANDDGMLAALEGGGDFDKTVKYLHTEKKYSMDQARNVAAQGIRLRDEMGAQAFALAALAKLPSTGTAYKGEMGVEAWLKDVNKHTGGNKSLAATTIAAGKSGFRSAQQYEFSEAGFGDMMEALDMVAGRKKKEDGSLYKEGEVGEHIVNRAYKAVGASGVVNARNDDSAKTFARAAVRDVQAAVSRGDKADIGRAVAQIENIRDVSGQGKRTVTDAYIDEISTANNTVTNASGQEVNIVEFARRVKEANDPEIMGAYYQVKHDYSTESAAAEAARQGQTPGATPPPAVGGGGPSS